jgi:phage terminase large subunit
MDILEHQADFIESDFIHTGLIGGYRSGKSQAGVIKTLSKKLAYPGIDVAYYLPTYGLIKDIAYPKFESLLKQFGVKYVLKETDHKFETPFGNIILRSLDNPNTIVGYEVGYSLIDEADILGMAHMEKAFLKIVARLSVPLPDGKPNSLDFVSTPEGFGFLYNFFIETPDESKRLINAKTRNNPFISKSYIKTLSLRYTEKQLAAYLDGQFVNLTTGSVYYKFDRSRNDSQRVIREKEMLHIGMDFNITKMAAVVHGLDFKPGGLELTAIGEFSDVYDTATMITKIKETYPGHRIIVYPDASGKNRKSSGSDTDHDLLKKAGFTLEVDPSNPSVKDRVTKMNVSFQNIAGKVSYFVNTKLCPQYTKALEQIDYKNGEPNKEKGLDHITEAGGYCAWRIFKESKTTKASTR